MAEQERNCDDWDDCADPDPPACEACWGEGFVSEAEYYFDWVNYSPDDYMVCPDCGGTGDMPLPKPSPQREKEPKR